MKKKLLLAFLLLILSITAAHAKDNRVIQLNLGQQYRLDGVGIVRYLLLDPGVITISITGNEPKIQLTALRKGTTYLHLWNSTGRETYRIDVLNPVIETNAVESRKKNITLTNKYEAGSGSSSSSYSANVFDYSWWYYQLKAQGSTTLGDLTMLSQVENRDDTLAPVYLHANLLGKQWRFWAGDNTAVFSDLTIPYVNYQGGLMNYHQDSLDVWLIGGTTGKKYWGESVWSQPPLSQTIYGGKVSLGSWNTPRLELVALAGSAEYSTDNVTSTPTGSVTNLSVGMTLPLGFLSGASIGGEYALDNNHLNATVGRFAYNGDKLTVQSIYRDVPSEFRSVSQYFAHNGERGLFNSGRLNWDQYLNFNLAYNSYHQLNLETNTDYANIDLNGGFSYRRPDLPEFGISAFQTERRGYTGGERNLGGSAQISMLFDQPSDTSAYYRYQPKQYLDSAVPSESYYNYKNLIGIESKFLPPVKLIIEHEENYNTIYGSETINRLRGYLKETFLGQTSFYTNLNFKYEEINNPNRGPWQEFNYDVEAGFKPASTSRVYIKYGRQNLDAGDSYAADRIVDRLQYGAQLALDTGIKLGVPRGDLAVLVYEDRNGNACRDEGEQGLAGIVMRTVQKGTMGKTDSAGSVVIGGQPAGDTELVMDESTLPAGFHLYRNNPYMCVVQSSAIGHVEIPVLGPHSMLGFVYHDTNENKIYDRADVVLRNVTFYVDNLQKITTDDQGRLIMTNLGEGEHTLQIELTSVIPEMELKHLRRNFYFTAKRNQPMVMAF